MSLYFIGIFLYDYVIMQTISKLVLNVEPYLHNPWEWPQHVGQRIHHIVYRWHPSYRYKPRSPGYNPGLGSQSHSSYKESRYRCQMVGKSAPKVYRICHNKFKIIFCDNFIFISVFLSTHSLLLFLTLHLIFFLCFYFLFFPLSPHLHLPPLSISFSNSLIL